ncbi:LysE family translocator, partial [Salmonella enterica subsp. enterica]|nr:LysE family translocator [Salmonella enterica subsp. enterica]
MSIAFLLTTLVVVATPGTGAVYSIAAGLSRGAKAGIIAAFGCTLGVIPHMVAAITGLAAILNASAIAFQTIKWLGVAYLLYLAWQTFRDKTMIDGDANP